jgi:hypothetical protein
VQFGENFIPFYRKVLGFAFDRFKEMSTGKNFFYFLQAGMLVLW